MKSSIKHAHGVNGYIFFVPSFGCLSTELEKTIAEHEQAVRAQEGRIAEMENYIQNARAPVMTDIAQNQENIAELVSTLKKIEAIIADSENQVCENIGMDKGNKYITDMCANQRKVEANLQSHKDRRDELRRELATVDKNIADCRHRLPYAREKLLSLRLILSESLIESIKRETTISPSV